ncbi:MAG: hypothetical protein WBV67_00355, partial [Candidatus Cybelea sp.]
LGALQCEAKSAPHTHNAGKLYLDDSGAARSGNPSMNAALQPERMTDVASIIRILTPNVFVS